MIPQLKNIDVRIQHFFEKEYDFKSFEIEFGNNHSEENLIKHNRDDEIKKTKNKNVIHHRSKKLNQEIKNIRRNLSRLDKQIKQRKCISGKLNSQHILRNLIFVIKLLNPYIKNQTIQKSS